MTLQTTSRNAPFVRAVSANVTALKVSVCIPVFNRERYIEATLRSVLAQTNVEFEIIVFDDASTDGTASIVAAVDHPRIRYHRQARNVGIARNRTSCLAVAKGEYIAWLDGDDLYHPDALQTRARVLDENPSVGLVHGAYTLIDYAGRKLPDWPMPFAEDTIESGEDALSELVLSNYIGAATVMVRRQCHEAAGPYSPRLRDSSEDWEMWMRIAAIADVAYIARPIAEYRFHSQSASSAAAATGAQLRRDIQALKIFLSRRSNALVRSSHLRKRAMAALAAKALLHAGDAFTVGRRTAALRATATALRLHPAHCIANGLRALISIARNDEYGTYRHTKAVLRQLAGELAGSRFARRLTTVTKVDHAWEETLARISETVKRVVPRWESIAVVDKWDPTILHLSGRKGWHFPVRELDPTGYPVDSAAAIRQLDVLVARGARYLVFPSASFWWLDFYRELREHLEAQQPVVADNDCIIYKLVPPTP